MSYLEPADGTVSVQFLRGLKPYLAKQLEKNAPEGWWTSSEDVFSKALAYETNRAAMLVDEKPSHDVGRPLTNTQGTSQVTRRRDENRPVTASTSAPAPKRPNLENPNKDIRIPYKEFQRRKNAKPKRCVMCGKLKTDDHPKDCKDKNPEPFQE